MKAQTSGKMDKKEVVIATMTLARNDEEEAVLRTSLAQLAKLNVPVFITDGGSGESFLQFLRSFSNFTVLNPQKGLWMQTINSLSAAYSAGSEFIFYTEPDKTGFFAHSLLQMLNEISVDSQTGIILASRSAKGFMSFPPFQQMTETTINNCCAEIIGETVDYVYGPFLLKRELVPYLRELAQHIGWGWRPYIFNIAKRLGYQVNAFTGDFLCPADQQQDNEKERIHRMRQLSQNIEGLILSTSVTLKE